MRPRPAAPPNAWVELAAEPAEVGERPPMDELLLQDPAGGLDGRVVVRVVLAGEGPPDIERLRQAVDAGVRELAAAIRAEHVDVRQREPQRGEGGLHQPRVLPAACRVPHDLAVAQDYEQASVVPFAADAHVGEIAHDVGMGRVAVELAVEDVGRLRLARLGGAGFVFLAGVGADQAFLIHYPLYPAPGGHDALPRQRALYLGHAALPAVVLVDSDDIAGYGVVRALGLGMRERPIVRGPGHAEHAAHGRDGAFSGVGADGGYFRANIGAACFETSIFMRSLLFSRSSPGRRPSSGILAAASVVTPASPRHLIHRESVELPRSYSAISSPLGLPAR